MVHETTTAIFSTMASSRSSMVTVHGETAALFLSTRHKDKCLMWMKYEGKSSLLFLHDIILLFLQGERSKSLFSTWNELGVSRN